MKAIWKSVNSRDGKRLVEIFDHGDGFYSFEESREAIEDIPDLGPETYWMCSHVSGLYDSPEAAEIDARATLDWFRE
ncbi:hypothetical protein [Novosphingobium beihaiensis]|uniref:Uncharacterized protein n=1 Tax=Novosphingobium beihaiensis TaxID=2930389 RepID=A0ABT0BNY2_9SPHN|nr:hypothetical protein [Novosphingobium beihaiensis]MCJ2186683.1 hypothetical protein [Novosphingobium beihaiensis]